MPVNALETLIKIGLAPALILQGKQVRKNTPRLPEAKGPRKGVQGKGKKPLRLLVLGDSAAAGRDGLHFLKFDLSMDPDLRRFRIGGTKVPTRCDSLAVLRTIAIFNNWVTRCNLV